MALGTLIVGTAKVVGNYIAKNGIAKAIKKFTKNSIKEGKKHYADVIKKDGGKTSKKASDIKKMKPVQAANANSRATLRKGLGIGAGTVGTIGAVALAANKLSKDDKKSTKGKLQASELPKNKSKTKKKVVKKTLPKAPPPKPDSVKKKKNGVTYSYEVIPKGKYNKGKK
tara:strand:+ start:34 stop:543 length:510 start_codon:yes stop_codon:yes gene_type:complete